MSEKYISKDYLHDKLVACKLEFLDARKYARAEGVGACVAIVFDAPTIEAEPTDRIDLQELEDRFGKYVRFVVEDMMSGEGKRWKNEADRRR